MGLLDKLTKDGSTLSQFDGAQPPVYNGVSQYQEDLRVSQLDLDGKQPQVYNQQSQYQTDLKISRLDLDGSTPPQYLNNLPQ
jgi:hypothetical protein